MCVQKTDPLLQMPHDTKQPIHHQMLEAPSLVFALHALEPTHSCQSLILILLYLDTSQLKSQPLKTSNHAHQNACYVVHIIFVPQEKLICNGMCCKLQNFNCLHRHHIMERFYLRKFKTKIWEPSLLLNLRMKRRLNNSFKIIPLVANP